MTNTLEFRIESVHFLKAYICVSFYELFILCPPPPAWPVWIPEYMVLYIVHAWNTRFFQAFYEANWCFLARICMHFCLAIFGFLSVFNCIYRANDRIMTGIRTKQGQRIKTFRKRDRANGKIITGIRTKQWTSSDKGRCSKRESKRQNNDRDKNKTKTGKKASLKKTGWMTE